MSKQIIHEQSNNLKIKNNEIRICINCGNSNIDFHEFGISCEECGVLLRRE